MMNTRQLVSEHLILMWYTSRSTKFWRFWRIFIVVNERPLKSRTIQPCTNPTFSWGALYHGLPHNGALRLWEEVLLFHRHRSHRSRRSNHFSAGRRNLYGRNYGSDDVFRLATAEPAFDVVKCGNVLVDDDGSGGWFNTVFPGYWRKPWIVKCIWPLEGKHLTISQAHKELLCNAKSHSVWMTLESSF